MGEAINASRINSENTLAIIVTYHPDAQFPERLKVIAEQVKSILVVDNCSNELAIEMLHTSVDTLNGHLILNSENLGVAKALNIGIEHALAEGYSWALLFDQDTVPGASLLEGLRRAYDGFPVKEKIAVIGANYIQTSTGFPRKQPDRSNNGIWIERRAVITSGSLVSLSIYQVLGPFRDEYFIDAVDLEFCLRARVNGFKVIMTGEPLMTHDVGRTVLRRFFWTSSGTSNHSGLRRYYIIRNQIDMAKRYFWKEPA